MFNKYHIQVKTKEHPRYRSLCKAEKIKTRDIPEAEEGIRIRCGGHTKDQAINLCKTLMNLNASILGFECKYVKGSCKEHLREIMKG